MTTHKVYFVGSNMPGYMPDEPPHPMPTMESAREAICDEIERDIESMYADPLAAPDGTPVTEQFDELRAAIKSEECDAGYAGSRFYFIEPSTMTAEELRDCDCDPEEYERI